MALVIFSDKYDYKIQWLKAFKEYSIELLQNEESIILGGDYNICPSKLLNFLPNFIC